MSKKDKKAETVKTNAVAKSIKRLATENYKNASTTESSKIKDIAKTIKKNVSSIDKKIYEAMPWYKKILVHLTQLVNKIKNLLRSK